MRKFYLPYRYNLQEKFPSLHLLGDAELAASLYPLYFLLEAEQHGKFYLIFDYHPTLPTSADELAALPQDILDATFAVLEFDNALERDREVEAIRRSLLDDGDAGAGVGARLRPVPPELRASGSKSIGDGETDEWRR